MGKTMVVRKEGGSRVVTLTEMIPADWRLVEVIVIDKGYDTVTVKINKVR